jgi:hypothetical protein
VMCAYTPGPYFEADAAGVAGSAGLSAGAAGLVVGAGGLVVGAGGLVVGGAGLVCGVAGLAGAVVCAAAGEIARAEATSTPNNHLVMANSFGRALLVGRCG